jgi:hypothetical protein
MIGETRRVQQASWIFIPEPSQPILASLFFPEKKKRGIFVCTHLRLRRMNAAAIATTTTMTAVMAIYVAVGTALVGSTTTGLGVGAIVDVGATVGFKDELDAGEVGAGVTAGDGVAPEVVGAFA